MITTALGEQQFTDQLLAAMSELGPADVDTLIPKVGMVICACPFCRGVPRPARRSEMHVFLARLLRSGQARGLLATTSAWCERCAREHDILTVRWERTD